jgi:hypothetical protein
MSSCDGLVEDISSEPVDSARLSECALELAELDIDHPSVLMKDLLWWITTVKTLQIFDELTCLPEDLLLRNCQALKEIVVSNASQLECLPKHMASLTSL